MMKTRRRGSTAMITGVAFGAMVMLAYSAHAADKIDGTGTVGSCDVTGKVKVKPALVLGGTSMGELKVIAKGIKESPCTGGTGDGAAVLRAKAKGTGTVMTNDCFNLTGMQPAMISITIKWKTDGSVKLNPSVVSITMQNGGTTGDQHGSFDVTGTVLSGSFTGGAVTAHIETDLTAAEILTACGDKGVKKITFGLNGNSTISVN